MPIAKTSRRKPAGTAKAAAAPARASGRHHEHLDGEKHESTLERTMRAVAALYRENGYEKTSMATLARRVGITAPALYHYFGAKEDILASFLEYTVGDLIRSVSQRVTGETATTRMESFIEAFVAWHLNQHPFPGAYDRIFALGHLRNSLPPERRNRVLALERRFYEICRNLIVAGIAAGEFRHVHPGPTAFAIIGMVDDILGWYRHDGALTPDQVAKIYSDLVVAMLVTPEARAAQA